MSGRKSRGNEGLEGDPSFRRRCYLVNHAEMLPLYQDPWFTFRFNDDRIIPRFHLEGVEARRRVSVFKIDPGTAERLGLMATAAGWTWKSR